MNNEVIGSGHSFNDFNKFSFNARIAYTYFIGKQMRKSFCCPRALHRVHKALLCACVVELQDIARLKPFAILVAYRRLSGRRCYLSRGSQNVLSRPRLTEDAISAGAHRTCYLGRGSQNVLSRPRLTEDAISDDAHRTCYLGRGAQKMLSRPRLTERAISDAFFFFKFWSGSPARAFISLLFLQISCLKIVINIRRNSLTMLLTIYYKYNKSLVVSYIIYYNII